MAQCPDGFALIANGLDTPQRWDGITGSTEQVGMTAPTAASTTTLDSGGAATAGDYVLYYRYLDDEGIPSNLSPVQSLTASANQEFNWTVTNGSGRAVYIELYRSTAGVTNVVYLVTTLDVGTTTFVDQLSDTTLGAKSSLVILNGDGSINANRFTRPPDYKAVVKHHLGRSLWYVDAEYSEGHVEVTNASASVTGIGTAFTSAMVDRYLYVAGEDEYYLITAVNTTTQVLTIEDLDGNSQYNGTTDKFAIYSIRPGIGERDLIYYSHGNEPESVPATYSLRCQSDGDDLTGGFSLGSMHYLAKRRHIYRLTFQRDPANDGDIYLQSYRGLVNDRCGVVVEGKAYCLDELGFHAFPGGEIDHNIKPLVDELNWQSRKWWWAEHDPVNELVIWHVCRGGGYLPKFAIAYHYRTGTWWTREYAVGLGGGALMPLRGKDSLIVGGESEGIYKYTGDFDITTGVGTLRATADSATVLSITDSDASHPSDVVGCTITIVKGTGKGQQRRVVSSSSGRLNIDLPWHILPDNTSVYQIGGIACLWKSGVVQYPLSGKENYREARVYYEPTETETTLNVKTRTGRTGTLRNQALTSTTLHTATVKDKPGIEHNTKLTKTHGEDAGWVGLRFDSRNDIRGPSYDAVQVEVDGHAAEGGLVITGVDIFGAVQ